MTATTERQPVATSAWGPGGDFTLGAEDELLLVDDRGLLLGQAALAGTTLLGVAPGQGAVTGEIFADEVELQTPVCSDAEGLARALGVMRESLTLAGVRAMAAAVHPKAELGTAVIASSPRYDRLRTEFAGLLRTPTAAFQVHVGLPDAESAIVVHRALRNRLSVFRALAAASPYWHGRDSGMACARAAIIRSYPRTTMPPALRDWADYLETVERQMAAADVPDYTYVCWELRPQPRLGTVEVRVMDAQPSLRRAAGLAALVQGLARHAVDAPDIEDLPDDVVLANDFSACRYALDGTVLDLDGSRRTLRKLAEDAVAAARRQLGPDGLDGPLDVVEEMLAGVPEHTRQRELCERQGMPALLADLVDRTLDPEG